ncbi:SDR family oxidoreductase [Patescibacteria group bacterium]|nr:SDR family oxidoreductase [Patescibacteria group bacterium]
MNLNNKTIIITGASEGIGRAITLRLAKEGTNLALIARNKTNLEEVKEKSRKNGALKVDVYTTDIGNTNLLENTVKNITNDLKTIDVLINNAGIWQKTSQVEDVKKEIIEELIATNLSGLIHMTRLMMPSLKKSKEAAVINIVSKSGVIAQEGQSVYSATKYGVRGFTEVLKEDLKNSKVRIAAIYQSGTDTKMFEKTGQDVPNEKFTKPEDLAEVVAFMLTRPDKIWMHDVRITY